MDTRQDKPDLGDTLQFMKIVNRTAKLMPRQFWQNGRLHKENMLWVLNYFTLERGVTLQELEEASDEDLAAKVTQMLHDPEYKRLRYKSLQDIPVPGVELPK